MDHETDAGVGNGIQRRALMQGLGCMPLLALLPGCGGGEDASADTAGELPPESVEQNTETATALSVSKPRTFVHPGLLHTEVDFKRMRDKIKANAQPWTAGWNALLSSSRAKLSSVPKPIETVVRGGPDETFRTMVEDVERAYQLALRWKISGDAAYGDLAVEFLNAWSSTLKTITGNNDRYLAAGIYGYQWANAAEIMRTYSGWAAADVARFQSLLLNVFYPLLQEFKTSQDTTVSSTYAWANWDMMTMCGILSIGVFCERADLYDEAIRYFKRGRGNGAAAHMVYVMHPGYVGQWQESARDQGHANLSVQLCGSLCEMAWNQHSDLYGYLNNRLLAGAEYVAKSNLTDAGGTPLAVPFSPYTNDWVKATAVSEIGRPLLHNGWERIYHHYVNRKGLAAPWVAAAAAKLRPEVDVWLGDDPSFGTLTHTRDPIAAGAPPSALSAVIVGGQVVLSWWGSAYAHSYRIKRGTSATGPFTAIASVTDPRTHTDLPANGVWFYCVTALSDRGESMASNVLRVVTPGELRLQLPLNEGSASVAVDTVGGRNGTLLAGANWGDGRLSGKGLRLDGQGGYVQLPAGIVADLSDFTVAIWAYVNKSTANARILDFGSSDVGYMSIVPSNSAGRMRFMITGAMSLAEQSIETAALPVGRWVHVAVTLSGAVATLYVDGISVGSNHAITYAPFQLSQTTRNWLGRSQYSNHRTFNGRLQDLRIHSRALNASEVAALAK